MEGWCSSSLESSKSSGYTQFNYDFIWLSQLEAPDSSIMQIREVLDAVLLCWYLQSSAYRQTHTHVLTPAPIRMTVPFRNNLFGAVAFTSYGAFWMGTGACPPCPSLCTYSLIYLFIVYVFIVFFSSFTYLFIHLSFWMGTGACRPCPYSFSYLLI